INLPPQSHAVYDAITTRLIAAFYPNCIKELTTVEGQAIIHCFQAKGVHILVPGWTILYPKKAEALQPEQHKDEKSSADVQKIPAFQIGEMGAHSPYINEGKTKPPAHYSENTLLGAMETAGKQVDDEVLKEALKEKGIGTPATRASIIEVLLKRKYIQRTNKALTATDLGRYLIAIIQDPNLKSPELTGEWESKLKAMEQGKYQAVDFMRGIEQFTHQLINDTDISKINYEEYGKCPKCKHPIIKGNRGYGCSKWREGCNFVLWKEYKGIELNEGQIRSLLQKHILLQPIQKCVLSLSDTGALLEIPIPVITPRRFS
ncbi:MAG: DNA topoisomerase III, partial [Parachlamydiaceae bacterium]|nr:DNA topoisomerase III [Parachlamydiaceae bacterium]